MFIVIFLNEASFFSFFFLPLSPRKAGGGILSPRLNAIVKDPRTIPLGAGEIGEEHQGKDHFVQIGKVNGCLCSFCAGELVKAIICMLMLCGLVPLKDHYT